MSRTENTRPGWLVDYADGREEHDHHAGMCIPETARDAHQRAVSRTRYHPRHSCPRWQATHQPCPGHTECSAARIELSAKLRTATWLSDENALAELRAYSDTHPYRCEQHTNWVPTGQTCTRCNARERQAGFTCTRRATDSDTRSAILYGVRASTPEDRRLAEHSARARTRKALKAAADDYNTYGDTPIQPEPTRHRHSAAWS